MKINIKTIPIAICCFISALCLETQCTENLIRNNDEHNKGYQTELNEVQYESHSKEYDQAFEEFLSHTNQKKILHKHLEGVIKNLPSRKVLIDAGAGEGLVTLYCKNFFEETIAIEPNSFLCNKLRNKILDTSIIKKNIMEAELSKRADLILCSHVLYYIEEQQWMNHVEKLLSWLNKDGVILITLQNKGTDARIMSEKFTGPQVELTWLKNKIQEKYKDSLFVKIDHSEAYVETKNLESAYIISNFLLNTLKGPNKIPHKEEVLDYIRSHFEYDHGKYRFSCGQDFLEIRIKDQALNNFNNLK